ncbi:MULTISPECIES: recombination regulator RecX [Legionella]|uniref:Regulatory protein RecX n=1 Tax=Legionella maceachernii TaxID=466 RepID=A0A0W0W024_9GAMM|nr:recombination regulator RecX [Legionella maceachernii]KTD25892.1 Regulatory protein RecX [Legionella maceachernii]SJZ47790.1 regulatory protein [Legionella maceachernii]SUP03879.1 Regulatory protein recX [Legionella maceachernii]
MTRAFDCALRLLGRREHSARELVIKLAQRGYDSKEVSEAIAQCQRLGLQSDARFVETLCHTRIRQGCGPLKISQELQTKHIDRELIDNVLEREQENWVTYALDVWHKKFKNQGEISFKELQKRQRFLLYRGFTADIIAKVIAEVGVGRGYDALSS